MLKESVSDLFCDHGEVILSFGDSSALVGWQSLSRSHKRHNRPDGLTK